MTDERAGTEGDTGPHAIARNLRDTRKQERAVLELPVVVSDASNKVQGGIRFQSADVSAGGAFLRTDLLFEVGEVLTLQFQLGSRVVRALGRVVRVSRDLTKDR